MYIPVIGLEIHVQVKTNSKMFCRCSANYFGKEPNINICPVCFGLPGALPVPNKTAFEKAIRLALALNCEITRNTKFDRKNYFYPDLPKGYQISQYDKPIGLSGSVTLEINGEKRDIRIKRVHLEEDTAKSIHSETETLIDYNKSGLPLAEIVTEPDFQSIEEVLAFAKRLRQIVRYTDTSDAEMQKGQMRYELNISLRKVEEDYKASKDQRFKEEDLPKYKVEVKNIGSISVLEKVIKSEIKRQSEILEKGEIPVQETRGLKDMTGETLSQRKKETSSDYRYFPEPDIAPITITEEMISEIKEKMPELPKERKNRYLEIGISIENTETFVEDRERGDYFDKVVKDSNATKEQSIEISKWINGDIAGIIEAKGININEAPITSNDYLYLIQMLNEKKITGSVAKSVISEIFETKKSAEEIIKEKNLVQIADSSEIDKFIDQVISENPKVVSDLSKNPNAIKFLVGQVMKLSKGKVNPNIAEEKLKSKISL